MLTDRQREKAFSSLIPNIRERHLSVTGSGDESLPLLGLRSTDGDDVDGDGVHAERSEEVLRGSEHVSASARSFPEERLTLVSASTSRGASPLSKADTSGTYWSFLSRSSSCNRKEIPRTGPFWIRFIKWVVTGTGSAVSSKP